MESLLVYYRSDGGQWLPCVTKAGRLIPRVTKAWLTCCSHHTVSVATTLPAKGFRARAMTNGGGYGDLPTDTTFLKLEGGWTQSHCTVL